jgi:hypothetical protein
MPPSKNTRPDDGLMTDHLCHVVKRTANQHGAWVTLACGVKFREGGCWPYRVDQIVDHLAEDA